MKSSKRSLHEYSTQNLQVEAFLNPRQGHSCDWMRGEYHNSDGTTIAVLVKPVDDKHEVQILERLAVCRPAPVGIVPVLAACLPTAGGAVSVVSMACHKTLDDVLSHRKCSSDPVTFLAVLERIAQGLASLHLQNIIHCDVKPDNVAVHEVDGDIVLWLIDFGDARLLDDESSWHARGPGHPLVACWSDVVSGNFGTATDSWCLAQCAAWLWNGGPQGLSNPANLDRSMPLFDELWKCLASDARGRPDAQHVARAARAALHAMGAASATALRGMLDEGVASW